MGYMMSKEEELHTKLGKAVMERYSKYYDSMKKVKPIYQNILKNKNDTTRG